VDNEPDLLFVMHDLARHLRMDADRRAAQNGMTRAQWMILFSLRRRPAMSQKELAEILEVEPITVGRLVDRLEHRQMVERRQDPADRRIWRLHLGAAAQPVLDEIDEAKVAMRTMAVAGLDDGTVTLVKDALIRMKANVVAASQRGRPPLERNVA
jgi:MarR family transcriptional regulator for hemolysin